MRDQDQHLPEAIAKRVLMRAAELDASRKTSLSIPDLRAAALEAGISSSALDQALNEVANSEAVSSESGDVGRRPRRRLIAMTVAITLIVLATSFVLMRTVAPRAEEVWYPNPTTPAPPLPYPPPPAPAPTPR